VNIQKGRAFVSVTGNRAKEKRKKIPCGAGLRFVRGEDWANEIGRMGSNRRKKKKHVIPKKPEQELGVSSLKD